MRIGIDARAAAEEKGGRGRYVRELLRHLSGVESEHRYVLYAREEWNGAELDGRFSWRFIPAIDPVWHWRAARAANRDCDAYLSTNSYLTAWFLRIPSVLVIFDMIAFTKEARPQRRSSLIEHATLGPAVRRAAAITAISESSRSDFLARYPDAAAKTKAIPLAADDAFRPDVNGDPDVLERHGLERPYVLVTGTLEPRKNLARLIEAFAALPEELRSGHELVLVGAAGWETDETFARIAAHRDTVRTLGYVPDAELPSLYRGAELFCYPSLYEGFGLPVLEAMRSGTPVITSNLSSMPEVGGKAVRYVDPRSVDDIRAALEELLGDESRRAELASAGMHRAAEFDWTRTARETLALIESTARS